MPLRIISVIVLVISAVAFPLFLTVLISIFCLFMFPDFYELIPIFFLSDVLYGISEHRYVSFPYVMTLIAVVAVLSSIALRRQMFGSKTFKH